MNANELRVFKAAVQSSAGNEHDFGYTQDLLPGRRGAVPGLTAQQIGGYLSALQDKGLIRIEGADPDHNVTQFTLTSEGFRLAGLPDHVGRH